MAYSSTNPPALMSQRITGAPSVWSYQSIDISSASAGSSYFSNGAALGMRTGDVMHITTLTTAGAYAGHNDCRVTVVTAGAGATITCATSST